MQSAEMYSIMCGHAWAFYIYYIRHHTTEMYHDAFFQCATLKSCMSMHAWAGDIEGYHNGV